MQKLEAKNIIIESGHFMATAILKFYQIENGPLITSLF